MGHQMSAVHYKEYYMKRIFVLSMLATACLLSASVQASSQKDYEYAAVTGVHDVQYFHGCWDSEDVLKRQRINVVMKGLSTSDVEVVSRPAETDKPTSAMITLRVKGRDASIKLMFRSNDGPHCQQGVHSISFTDKVVRSPAQLGVKH